MTGLPGGDLEGPPDIDPEEPEREGPAGPSPAVLRPVTLLGVGVVFVGGFFGALARDLVERAIPMGMTGFPAATWTINTSGALLIGVIATFLTARPAIAPWWRLLLVTGVLGAWTTMSSIAAETDGLVHAGRGSVLLALGYLAATATAGVVGCAAGVMLGRALAGAAGAAAHRVGAGPEAH